MGELSDNLSKQAVIQRGPKHVSRNPIAQGLNVTVSVPETIEIRMVEASALADYEMWFFLASVLANAVVGFGVAYYQDQTETYLLSITLIFLVLFIASAAFAFYKRYKLCQQSKAITLRASEVITDIEDKQVDHVGD